MGAAEPRSVAVVGGGLQGLVVARALAQAGCAVRVYERAPRPGGNADTRALALGGRWVDLGVSDFNRAAYHRLTALLDSLGVLYRPMHPSVGFFDREGSLVYALGRRHGAPPPPELMEGIRAFRRGLCAACEDPEVPGLTVDAWLARGGFGARFAADYLRPRLHALWFCGEEGPGALTMAAVLGFYALQEGFVRDGEPRPERMYPLGGTRRIVEALIAALPPDSLRCGVSPRVLPGERPGVFDGARLERFDAVVLAAPADASAACLEGPTAAPLQALLRRVRYQDAWVLAHTDARLLGPNPNAWGSFNVRILPREEGPYSVTVVGNLLQNDAAEGLQLQPGFFTTANPWREVPEALCLRGPDGAPVARTFRHTVLDREALAAARALPALQGQGGVWVAGGWTVGVGLMEDLLESAEILVNRITGA